MSLFSFDNSFAEKMEGFYVNWSAAQAPEPELLCVNRKLAEELNIDLTDKDDATLAQLFSGNERRVDCHHASVQRPRLGLQLGRL